MVYFLKYKNLIKIGYTRRLASRIDVLQRKFPGVIFIKAISGFREKEKKLHKMFSEYRVYGEWFHATPSLMSYIACLEQTVDDIQESPYSVIDETLRSIGRDVKRMRLNKNITQDELSINSGSSKTAVRHLESGSGSSLRVFVKVASFFGKKEWLDSFSPRVSINPLNMVHGKQRRRATGRRK